MKFIHKYYLFSLFASADFTRGIHLVYILNIGFSNFYTGWLQFILFVTSFLFEIPSGYLADKFKRKYSLLAGSGCFIFSAAIYLISQDYLLITLLYFLQGLGFSFYSGANEALLYQKVLETEALQKDYFYYLAKARMVSTYSLTISILLGSLLVSYGYKYVFVAFLCTNIVAFLAAISFSERNDDFDNSIVTVKRTFETIKGPFLGNILLIISLSLIESAHTPYFIFFQNYLEEENVPAEIISIIFFIVMLIGAISFRFSPYLKNIPVYTFMLFVNIILGLLLVTHFVNLPWYSYLVTFLFFNSIPNLLFVKTDDLLAGLVDDKNRATFLSWISLINSIMISISYLTLGYLFDIIGTKPTLGLLIIPIFLSLVLTIIWKNKKHEPL